MIQDLKLEFNKKVEMLKRTQPQMKIYCNSTRKFQGKPYKMNGSSIRENKKTQL